MFDNMGAKLKLLAKIIACVGIIGSIAVGLWVLLEGPAKFFPGIAIMVGGSLVSWAFTWILYGVGEIVDVSYYILQNTRPAPGPRNPDDDSAVEEAIAEWKAAEEKKKKEARKKAQK